MLAAALLLSAPAVIGAEKPIVMTTSVGSPLYRKNGTGLYNLLLQEIFRRLEMDYELVWLPAKRSLADTNNGTYDGNLARTAMIEQKNPSLLRIPKPVYEFEFMVYSRRPRCFDRGCKP